MNNLGSKEATVVLEPPAAAAPTAGRAAPNTPDQAQSSADGSVAPAAAPQGEFTALLENYRALLRARSIPYPVVYRFTKELGHGRQGVVFLATRHGARGCLTEHAIKIFDPGIYSSAARYWTDMGRIAQQVSLLQPINNVNLVSGNFYEECNGIGYIHMSAIDGIDLQFLMDGRHLEFARERSTSKEWKRFLDLLFRLEDGRVRLRTGLVLYILRNVLRGLAALHANGFIHGDIKPTNIMINIQGTVKLVDFGRAARLGEPINILLGSPLYMAPENHRREPGVIPSDIFSTGLVGLAMLNARQMALFAEQNENNLLDFKTTLAGRIEQYLPEEILRNVEFVQVLKRFLEPDPVNRFASAAEAEAGAPSLLSARQWLSDRQRETEYERELEAYLLKLVDEETGRLNPHFASDNLTAVIEV
ncbi:MAG: protein kinase [Lentisphaerae bacterium]|nr:protein kinase [Lentisphaerota bacterium]